MPRYHFERESRTWQSESVILYQDDCEIGRADIHYASDVVRATLCVPELGIPPQVRSTGPSPTIPGMS